MRGRKPNLDKSNVVSIGAAQKQPEEIAFDLRPHNLPEPLACEWDKIAPELVKIGRLKPYFVDTVVEYCICRVRLKEMRELFKTLSDELYEVEGRNGKQLKTHPHVAQLNETWRQWRNLSAALGLTPTDERALDTEQMSLFDEFNPVAKFASRI